MLKSGLFNSLIGHITQWKTKQDKHRLQVEEDEDVACHCPYVEEVMKEVQETFVREVEIQVHKYNCLIFSHDSTILCHAFTSA